MRKILFLCLFALSLSASASDNLIVKQKDGNTSWVISTIHEITFDGNGVKISFTDGQSVYYTKENLNMLQFNVTPSNINNIETKNAISLKGNTIIVNTDVESIKVYSLNGTLVTQSVGNMLNISNLGEGTYIVKAGNLITKIVKK